MLHRVLAAEEHDVIADRCGKPVGTAFRDILEPEEGRVGLPVVMALAERDIYRLSGWHKLAKTHCCDNHSFLLVKHLGQLVRQTVQVVQFLFRHGTEFALGEDLLQAEERIVPRFATSHAVAARNGLRVLALFNELFFGQLRTP